MAKGDGTSGEEMWEEHSITDGRAQHVSCSARAHFRVARHGGDHLELGCRVHIVPARRESLVPPAVLSSLHPNLRSRVWR